MVFSSLFFLFAFLPITLIGYYLAPIQLKNVFLLLMSLFFYAWGEPIYVLLMIGSILSNYMLGLLIHQYRKHAVVKKGMLTVAMIINLGVLGFYKYSDFLIYNLNRFFGMELNHLELALPIGISFFTFQALSYVIDVYREESDVQRNLFSLALYIALFPQLIAGPIVRYNTIDDQIKARTHTLQKSADGLERFIIGLSKKVLLANSFAVIADHIFEMPAGDIALLTSWIGILAYTLQIYFDFSGYSDMAIGLGKLFGFDFLENFRYPYIATSITDFWRRWHISLSTWFKDYVYIPLGGNRGGVVKQLRNLLIVWFLTGLWHGSSWTFILWGLYFGVLLITEKFVFKQLLTKLPAFFRHSYALFLIMIGWVFFRSESLTHALMYLRTMFGLTNEGMIDMTTRVTLHDDGFLFIIGMIAATPIIQTVLEKLKQKNINSTSVTVTSIILPMLYITLFMLVVIKLVNSTYNPFIYFRF